ncbi:MAG: stage V sporulation protein AD, partial [Lachnospiraceae bacterium]|nr:stage V sporulation protein AD [Lachnospiraceae bacterium]
MSEDNLCTAGSQSVKLKKEVYINGSASIVGKNEGAGPRGLLFDMGGEDAMCGCKT